MKRKSLFAPVLAAIVFGLSLIACSTVSSTVTSSTTATIPAQPTNTVIPPTNTAVPPTNTPAPTDCGLVHNGPPGLSPANYKQLIDCFASAFQQCHLVLFEYDHNSADSQTEEQLSLSGTAGNCTIHVQEHFKSFSGSTPIDTNLTYTCAQLVLQSGSYVIQGCSNSQKIFFP